VLDVHEARALNGLRRRVFGSGEFRRHWQVAVAGFGGNALGAGALLYFGLASFVKPMEQALGWTRLQIGFAATLFTLVSVLILPVIGRACDRVGARRVVLPSILALSIGLAALALAPAELWIFHATFLACSLLGAGTLGISYAAAITRAFDANRGFALGLSLSGAGFAAFLLPLLLQRVIADYGWRAGWLALGAIALLQFPVAYGLLPRHDEGMSAGARSRATDRERLIELVRTRQFCCMSLPFFVVALVLSGHLVNLIALLSDRGLSMSEAAATASLVGVGILIARLLVGLVVDLVSARWVAAFVFALSAAGAVCLLSEGRGLETLGAFLFGFTTGAEYDLLAYMASRYFGGRQQNTVLGAGLSLFNAGAVMSPVLVGGLYEANGHYRSGLGLVIVGCLLAALFVTRVGPYPEVRADAAGSPRS
jgi:MFS family permease